jgi:ubiquinone/menaquinone biosynthesis C-methylase UbiE
MDAVEDHMWWYRALRRRLVDALADVRGTLLDAGCGTGGMLARLRAVRPDLRLLGLEMDASACRRAAAKSGARIVRGSVNAMPFAAASLDAVIMADVLCHEAVDPAVALGELGRVLRPGGRLVINMPAYAWLCSAHDQQVHNARRYTLAQVRALLAAAGFRHVRGRYWNSLLLPLMVVQRKLLARGNSESDVAAFPPWLDAMLLATTELERHLPVGLPMGGSVLAIAERP